MSKAKPNNPGRKYWIFQAVPEDFDLPIKLKDWGIGEEGSWVVTQHKSVIRKGDLVLLWQTGASAAFHALAKVCGSVRDSEPGEDIFANENEMKVPIRLVRKFKKLLSREELRKLEALDPIIAELPVLKGPYQGTNKLINSEQWASLAECLGLNGSPGWTTQVFQFVCERYDLGGQFKISAEDVKYFSKRFPGNHRIRAKLRQKMQILRDKGIIEFVNNRGTYRLIKNRGVIGISEHDLYPHESSRSYAEGKSKRVFVNRHERSRSAREECIRHHGDKCLICGFDFSRKYPGIGEGYIHVHHLEPLSNKDNYQVDPINDLVPVCPNCHAMLHKNEPPYSVEKLRGILRR